jgi:hypothetical protein
MPSPEKMKRINELCEKYSYDYFNNPRQKETIEIILEDEFPDEIDRMGYAEYEYSSNAQEHTDKDTKVILWFVGSMLAITAIILLWKYIVAFLILAGIVIFLVGKFFALLFSGGAGSSNSSSYSSYKHKQQPHVTYGLQRASGPVWYTIAQGPENWMIDKMEQNRAKDGHRYRVVRLVDGKPSGTTFS